MDILNHRSINIKRCLFCRTAFNCVCYVCVGFFFLCSVTIDFQTFYLLLPDPAHVFIHIYNFMSRWGHLYCKGILTFYLFKLLYYIASEGYCFARQNASNRKQFITDGMSNTKHSKLPEAR